MNPHSCAGCAQPMTPELLERLREAAKVRVASGCEVTFTEAIEEVERLRAETAVLRTPHACWDCEHLHPKSWSCTTVDNPIFKVYNPRTLWLCGHFKAKGTK